MHKLFIILTLSLAACGKSPDTATSAPIFATAAAPTLRSSLPAGFSVVEQSPEDYFIRLASAERASSDTIRELAESLSGKFDRVDLCLDVAHERGDEYLSIIDGMIYDYENNNIYSLNTTLKCVKN